MYNSLRQQEEELAVFKDFMRIYGCSIIENSIIQQKPPKPDIFCKLECGYSVEFELTNAIDPQLAQKTYDDKISDKGGFCGEITPIEIIVLEKNCKLKEGNYTLRADRFELLVYLGRMPIFPYWKRAIPDFLNKNKDLLEFDRIWIFQDCQENLRILWSYSKSAKERNCL